MSTDRWQRLSDWHNAWLATPDPDERDRLRQHFADAHPDLAAEAAAMASGSAGLSGFLETPALAFLASDFARDDPPLAVDALVGPYRIVGLLAHGGMGVVYRATDVRLCRDVALKLLAPGAADDSDRVSRFLEEARITAGLDHPNIVKVFDVGMHQGQPYLVAELHEGETLRTRLGHGALPPEDVRRIARAVCAGLVVAHAAGLVHRDLKPDNIFLTHSGAIKILDFGIAKLAEGPAAAAGSATLTAVVLGTPGYLAPEQICGEAVDSRTDLFALGAVLFEMATGQRAFARDHTIDTLHAIVHDAPPSLLPPGGTPGDLAAIVMRLLEKSPAARFQSAADTDWALAQVAVEEPGNQRVSARRALVDGVRRVGGRRLAVLAGVMAFASGAIWLGLSWRASAIEVPMPVRFSLFPPAGNRFVNDVERTHFAFSPDGSQLGFIARSSGVRRIWLRPISGVEPRPLAGTDGAFSFFWSPDGKSIAFFAGSKLKRLDLPDGAAVPLCDVPDNIGLTGTWGADGEILFASVEGDAISSLSTRGGTPATLMTPDRARGEMRVSWPWFLPDGRRFLYSSRARDGTGHLMIGEPGRSSRAILPAVSNVQWVDPDFVVFVRDGVLVGQRFDLRSEHLVGAPFSIAEPVDYTLATGRAEFATSRNGNLAYQSHTDIGRLAWSDRHGATGGELGMPGAYQSLRLSPDGTRVLFDRAQPGIGTQDVWIRDLARGGETRVTSETTSESYPVWLRDGLSVVFMANRDSHPPYLFRKSLVTNSEVVLVPPGRLQGPDDVSPDGQTLAFEQRTPLGNNDILAVALAGGGRPSALLVSAADEIEFRFSPDGHAAAFLSDESGTYEVYVAPYPALTPRLLVSTGGGRLPRWNPAGGELIYLTPAGDVVTVSIRTSPTIALGPRRTIFTLPGTSAWTDVAISADGQRFLSISPVSRGAEQPVTIVLHWPASVAQR